MKNLTLNVLFIGDKILPSDLTARCAEAGLTRVFNLDVEIHLIVIHGHTSFKLDGTTPVMTFDNFIDTTLPALEREHGKTIVVIGGHFDLGVLLHEGILEGNAEIDKLCVSGSGVKPQPSPADKKLSDQLADAIKSERHYMSVLKEIGRIFGKNLGVDIGVDNLVHHVAEQLELAAKQPKPTVKSEFNYGDEVCQPGGELMTFGCMIPRSKKALIFKMAGDRATHFTVPVKYLRKMREVSELVPGNYYEIHGQKVVGQYSATGVVDGAQKLFEVYRDGDLTGEYVSADTLCCRESEITDALNK
ncbi:hypothetical protein NVP2044O_25 [Vibrio phage 2.044.O._10N.261.51.B8]|nr:hypothetical protein NVP2044O_25 [Vibrio phage 2.044.O._10N.261.51.B8]